MKSFELCKRQEVAKIFQLKRLEKWDDLEEWITITTDEPSEQEQTELEELRLFLKKHVLNWNESELKFYFLNPLIRMVHFFSSQYNSFLGRSLSINIGQETASGKIDFMVAQGEQLPEALYFCLHEYKHEAGSSNDPLGQLLIAMIAVQQANKVIARDIPIYGTYVLGRYFYFVLLHRQQYAVSEPYIATRQQDLQTIFMILKKVKTYIKQALV